MLYPFIVLTYLIGIFPSILYSRNVYLDVVAPWPKYPVSFLSQTSEFLTDQFNQHSVYYQYAHSLCQYSSKIDLFLKGSHNEVTVNELQTISYDIATTLTSPTLHSLMDTLIGMGYYVPSVRFYESLSMKYGSPCGDGESFVVIFPGDVTLCEVKSWDQFQKFVQKSIVNPNEETNDQAIHQGLDWEHYYDLPSYSSSLPSTTVKVILYGVIGSSSFCLLHTSLVEILSIQHEDLPSVSFTYSTRHAFPGLISSSNHTKLQGYGVFLDIKNMEYKNVDDSLEKETAKEVDSSAIEEDYTFPEDEELLGVNLSKLRSKLKASLEEKETADKLLAPLHRNLHSLRMELQQMQSDEEENSGEESDGGSMKVWKLKDLDLQMVQFLCQSIQSKGLATATTTQILTSAVLEKVMDIVHNFPRKASSLSSIKVPMEMKDMAISFYQQGLFHALPMNSLFINGKRYDLGGNTYNVYDVLDQIREEVMILTRLDFLHSKVDSKHFRSIKSSVMQVAESIASGKKSDKLPSNPSDGSSQEDVVKMVNARIEAQVGSPIVRIDVSKGAKYAVQFANNLERDSQYKAWPRSLNQLLYPAWSLHAIARNIYTLVAIVNPISKEGASIITQLEPVLQQSYPVRVAFAFTCGSFLQSDHPAANLLSNQFCRLYSKIKDVYKPKAAISFVFAVANFVINSYSQQFEGSTQPITFITESDLLDLYSSVVSSTRSSSWDAKNLKVEAKETLSQPLDQVPSQFHFVKNSTLYVESRGIPINSITLNGIVLDTSDMDGEEGLLPSIMQLLGREQFILATYYQNQLISDSTNSIFSSILTVTGAHPRFHPMLEDKTIEYVDFNSFRSMNALNGSGDGQSIPFLLHYPHDPVGSGSMANTTILFIPINPNGFHTAITAFRWLLSKPNPAEITRKQIGPKEAHRMAIVFNLPQQHSMAMLAKQSVALIVAVSKSLGSHYQMPWCGTSEWTRMKLSLLLEMFSYFDRFRTSDDLDTSIPTSEIIALVEKIFNQNAGHVELESYKNELIQSIVHSQTPDGTTYYLKEALSRSNYLREVFEIDASVAESCVIYNARKLMLHTPVHELDLDLLSSLEETRMGRDLQQIVRDFYLSVVLMNEDDTETVPDQPNLSDLLVKISSFCGYYSSTSSKRFDVEGLLKGVGIRIASGSSLTNDQDDDDAYVQKMNEEAMFGDDRWTASNSFIFHYPSGKTALPNEDTHHSSDPLPTAADDDETDTYTSMKIVYLFDPLSVAGQRAVSLIKLIHDHLHYHQIIVLTPRPELSEFPLQNFYRSVISPHDDEGEGVVHDAIHAMLPSVTKAAWFSKLPKQHVLTVRMDAPEPWNVQASSARQDIDNLRCIRNICGDTIFDDHSVATHEGQDEVRKQTATIRYMLKSLVVAGQCFEAPNHRVGRVKLSSKTKNRPFVMGRPPNGLQLILMSASADFSHTVTTRDSEVGYEVGMNGESDEAMKRDVERGIPRDSLILSDTLVMQNLGYFQLQANPGLFAIHLASGKATALFTIAEADHVDPSDRMRAGLHIAVRTFGDAINRLMVVRRPGMESVSLLDDGQDDEEEDSYDMSRRGKKGKGFKAKKGGEKTVWNSLTSSLFGTNSASKNKRNVTNGSEDGTVHIFSLATGHMYERLLRIMMLSVSRHCSRPVKFWLLENYLSPTFKSIVTAMSETYGFEVAYVTYKWPQWLTQQTQKQRIIWGYKILFLDVLFPLNIKKVRYSIRPPHLVHDGLGYMHQVIYVDSDQVVRSDLAELWDLDLQGKPYAYTPFCTSREETLGFQFWRQGYWHDHLQGKPYHISALYVVDLQRFRRNAVGDQLRAVYDSLSRDPNSLANLDQDLPNYAQHSVPIFSLPQEWLWCETWCSDASKSKAKTIDLCNNPLHKEPKLDMARRIISGKLFNQSWVDIDEEIKALQKQRGLLTSTSE